MTSVIDRQVRAMLMADLVGLWEGLSRLGCRQWLMDRDELVGSGCGKMAVI